MAKLFNRAKMTTSTTGSGTVVLASASVGYQTFAAAGVSDGDVVQYVIEEGGNFEIGTGTYSATGTSLTRSVTESSNAGSAITLNGAATVSITAVADDLNRLQYAGSTKVEPTSSGATVTGNLAVTGTVDGVDIASRDSVLTSTTSTANAALPKAGGTMTGAITFAAGQTFDGRDVSADGSKLDGIETGATADQTASEILTAIKTVDGASSGLDADLLDGNHASAFATSGHNHTLDSLSNTTITSNTSGEILKWNGTAWVNNTLAEAGIQPSGSYLTGNQTITLSGDLSGSGTTSINAQLASNVVGANELNVTGNGTTSQFLRSDGDGTFTWATPTDTNTTYSASTGLTLTGTAFSVNYGTTSGTACQGNDSRLSNSRQCNNSFDSAATARTNLGLGSLATLSSVNAATITDNSVGAAELNVTGNGTTSQFLRSDGDGTFTWATPTDTNTTYSAGTNMSLSGTTFSVVASPTFTTVTATDFNTTSDVTLKTNIAPLTDALGKVMALDGVSFDWIGSGDADIGLIAQDVEVVLPDLVKTDNEGIKSVKYSNIVAVLIEAIKEQQAQIDALKQQLR